MIPGNANPLLLASAAAAAGPTDSNRSLRFNKGDSAHLDKTFSSAGNRKKWTFAAWIKRSLLATTQRILRVSEGTNSEAGIQFLSNDKIEIYHYVSGYTYQLNTTAVFRDPSSFLHIVVAVDTTQATAADRVTLYINGSEVTDFSTSTYPTQNFEGWVNDDLNHSIAGQDGLKFSGYMSHVFFIDGSALNATSFGSFDSNGVWQKADYSGTFGTNGFHLLDFANESTIGADSSGNNNDFTANNFSDTAGAGNDVLFDYPANGDSSNDSGAGGQVNGNYATLNPLSKGSNVTLSNGNLVYAGSAASGHANKYAFSTIAVSSGKWYAEATCDAKGDNFYVGVMGNVSENYTPSSSTSLGFQATGWGYWTDGDIYNNGSVIDSAPASVGVGDVIGVALDVDNRTVTFYKNGTQQGSTATSLTADATWMFSSQSFKDATVTWNFGQRSWDYSAPSGFKPLNTTFMSAATIADGSDYFDIKTYTGNGGTQTISGYDFSPDFVWLKMRSGNNTTWHVLADTIRGNNALFSNATNGEIAGYVNGFTSNGFGVQVSPNDTANVNNNPYVAWAWDAGSSTATNTDGSITTSVRVNQTAGFSIATYSYNNSLGSQTLGHGLGSIPDLVIRKDRNLGEDWSVYSKAIGFTQRGHLNTAGGWTGTSTFGSASATSTVNRANNMNNGNYVDYSFVSIPGFSLVSTYPGNGSNDGSFVYCGFRPAFVLIKRNGSGANWYLLDTTRDTHNVANSLLRPNLPDAEVTAVPIDILSNGFKLRDTDAGSNVSGANYLFYAVAENPFQANGGLAR